MEFKEIATQVTFLFLYPTGNGIVVYQHTCLGSCHSGLAYVTFVGTCGIPH